MMSRLTVRCILLIVLGVVGAIGTTSRRPAEAAEARENSGLPRAMDVVRAALLRGCIRAGLQKTYQGERASMEPHGGIPVLHLYGTPKQIGQQYGTALKDSLVALDLYMRALLPGPVLQAMQKFGGEHERFLPEEVRTELQAISEASGMPYLDLVTLNVIPKVRCTALAAWGDATGDGQMIMGRNAEYFSFGLGDSASLIVVYHPEEGLPVAAVGFLGLVGAYTGINAKGVAFGNMLVFNARKDGPRAGGIAPQLAMRLAAHRSDTAEQMCKLLRDQKRVIPVNVMIADPKEAVVAELALDGSRVRRGERSHVAAANHFRSADLRERVEKCPRYAILMKSVGDNFGKLDAAVFEHTLHAARMRGLNLQAVVFLPGRMKMHLSANRIPASAGPYVEFDLKELFEREPGPKKP